MPAQATITAPPAPVDAALREQMIAAAGRLMLWTWPLYDASGRVIGIDRDRFHADLSRLKELHVAREQILAEAEAELHADLEQTYGRETAALIRSKIAYARWAKGRRA